jgi:two-component system, sensor histidine kinase and response regulator
VPIESTEEGRAMFEYKPEKTKVLLVDDDRVCLERITTILLPLNLDIVTAHNALDAHSLLSQNTFDMILLDVMIPTMEGYELCRHIKETAHNHDLAIVFMSKKGDHEDKLRGFESGADDYLVKPFYDQELLARVKLHLKKQTLVKHLKGLLKRSYHELYNPLSIIKTSAEMYGYRYPKNHYVDTMHAAAKSLHLIYEDLYYALGSKKTPSQTAQIDLALFLKKRVQYFTLLAEVKQIRIELKTQEGCIIDIPQNDLQRIVDNTISNAIKHSFEKNTVEIELSKNRDIKLQITNYGITIIHPEYIFTDGYREAYNTVGMGIGLEIVSSLCERFDIRAQVLSDGGKTTFTYRFSGEEPRCA